MPSLPRRLVRRARTELTELGRGSVRRRARAIVDAGLFDRSWYEQQTGTTWPDDRQAAQHYLAKGRRAGHSPHPLLEPDWVDPSHWATSRRDPVDSYLAGRAARGGPHPLFDDATWLAAHPHARRHPGGALGYFLATAAPGTPLPAPWAVVPVTLEEARTALIAATLLARSQPAGADAAAPPSPPDRDPVAAVPVDRQHDLTSVVVTSYGGWAGAWSLVEQALTEVPLAPAPDAADVEVVLVDRGSRASVARILASRQLGDPRVRFVRLASGPVAHGWDAGLARTAGARVVLVDAEVAARPSGSPAHTPWWRPLVDALDDPDVAATAPLVVGPGAVLEHAGLGRHRAGATPYRMFHAAAPEDVAQGEPLDVVALGDEVVAARAEDLVRSGGSDAGYVAAGWGADLSVRLAALTEVRRRLRVVGSVSLFRSAPVPSAEVAEAGDTERLVRRCEPLLAVPPQWDEDAAWQRSGLALAAAEPVPRVGRRQADVDEGPAAGRPALRWAIGTAAPFTDHGDRWGDVHFAAALAAALRRLGQHVVVERRLASGRSTAQLDEVFLNIRGLDQMPPRHGQLNLLWVISHPDRVTAAEVRAYDTVFSAGPTWARTMSAQAGIPVLPLLQATDPEFFHPDLAEPGSGPDVLFVGNSRGAVRPIVRDAVAAGLDLAVYGTRWEGFLDPRYVRGTYLPNETVGAAYRSAGVLLNDHWADMAEQGFYSNRLFDAVAAGARVISDPVDGLAELFDGAVLEYRDPADLARWAGVERDTAFPDDARLLEISARVRREHSFDARAATLLDAALRARDRVGAADR